MLRITMLSEIIKENPTSCYFLGSQKPGVKSLSNVERAWAGSCVITIETPREPTARRGYEVAERS